MKPLLTLLLLLTAHTTNASEVCPSTQSLRELSKSNVLVVRVNKRIEFEKNSCHLEVDNVKINLRNTDKKRTSIIEAGSEFVLSTPDDFTGTYGPLLVIENSLLKYMWVHKDFDFESYTADQLAIATRGTMEIRCDNNPRVIKP